MINKVEKLIINLDMQRPVTCAWDTCDRWARTSHQVRAHEHPLRISCSDVNAAGGSYGRHMIYAFCCEGHLDFWVASSGSRAHDLAARNRGLVYGQHSAGMKRSLI